MTSIGARPRASPRTATTAALATLWAPVTSKLISSSWVGPVRRKVAPRRCSASADTRHVAETSRPTSSTERSTRVATRRAPGSSAHTTTGPLVRSSNWVNAASNSSRLP